MQLPKRTGAQYFHSRWYETMLITGDFQEKHPPYHPPINPLQRETRAQF